MHVNVITASGVEQRSAEELPALLNEQDRLIWVDIPSCDAAAVSILTDVFGFHPMAIQDCVERNRVPKVHVYPDHVFVVLHAPERGQRGHVHYIELDQFVGQNYVVTVHGPLNPVVDPQVALRETGAVLRRIEAGRLTPSTPYELSYAIVSALTRNQEAYIEVADQRRVAAGAAGHRRRHRRPAGVPQRHVPRPPRPAGGAHHGRAERRDLRPDRHPCPTLRRPPPVDHRHHRPVRPCPRIADGEREYLQGVIEFYQTTLTLNAMLVGQAQNEEVHNLTRASYSQNEEIKKISAWAGIFFAPSLIGTVYGMNFDNMPELHWTLGYPFALVLMVLTSAALYMLFKRLGWL